jgi:hypothetical protein
MKVTSGFNTANSIESHQMANSLGDLQLAVRADPGLAVFRVCTDGALNGVFNSALEFGATKTTATGKRSKIKLGFFGLLGTLRAVASRH